MTDEQILAELCRQAGTGVRAVQGAVRDQDTVAARHAIARALRRQAGWTIRRIAVALDKTERAIEKMVRK